MKPFFTIACALFVAGNLPAQVNYNVAIRQARNAADDETAASQKGLEDPNSPAQPPQNNPATPSDPALQATRQNIDNLRNDFITIGNAAPAASLASLAQSLTNDLVIASQGNKPQTASISKLADDLVTAMAGKEKFRAPQLKLAQYVHAIFNGSHLTTAQQQMIFDGVKKILTDGGASPGETANVVGDIKTIASETK